MPSPDASMHYGVALQKSNIGLDGMIRHALDSLQICNFAIHLDAELLFNMQATYLSMPLLVLVC